MAKQYIPKQITVSLSSEDFLDIAFGLRLARSIEFTPKQLAEYDDESKKLLQNLSGRYLRIAEEIEKQVSQ
jgi:hypothetical protein